MLGGKLKDAATRCVLRVIDESKCVLGRSSAPDPLGELTALPRPPGWIWGVESEMETTRDGKGTEGIGK